jgi:hypothetical protein
MGGAGEALVVGGLEPDAGRFAAEDAATAAEADEVDAAGDADEAFDAAFAGRFTALSEGALELAEGGLEAEEGFDPNRAERSFDSFAAAFAAIT